MITNGYCTLAEIKARLDITDTKDDASLESVVGAASRWIDSRTGKRFYTVTETRTYTTYLDWLVEIDDLVSLTSLKTDPAGDGTYTYVWAAADYRLYPYNAVVNGQPYTAIEVAQGGAYRFSTCFALRPRIQVAGSFGYSAITAIPPAIKEACILASMRIWGRKDLVFGISGSAELGTLQAITSLGSDGELKALLSTVKRRAIV